MGRLRHARTYSSDERGIAYGVRTLWRRRGRSSRRSNDRPGRTGKPSAGPRTPGDSDIQKREVCEMQSAETVLGVLRERGRQGLPLEELYRQMFNPQLYLLAYGRIYANKGAMTPGVTQETVDGMSRGGSRTSSMPFVTSDTDSPPCAECSSPRSRRGSSGRSACPLGATRSSARWCVCCLRRTTSRRSLIAPTGSGPAGAATPLCGRWPRPGPERPG